MAENYRGYDPFDALLSPLFQLPVLRTNKLARFGAQQVVKRSPVNLRSLLAVPKGENPVTFGLCLQAFTALQKAFVQKAEHYRRQIAICLEQLEALQSKGYSGACWGYDFDWEARYAKIPAYTPTVVATGFITNALFEYYQTTGDQRAFNLCESATHFVRNDLHKTRKGEVFCYSYSPLDQQVVFNASMKGARLLMQVYSVTGDETLRKEAAAAVAYVMDLQRADGAWSYAHGDARTWVDNFHTAYLLDCLDVFLENSQESAFEVQREKGLDYYLRHFFEADGAPKYYDQSLYPVDATAAAQSILTLSRVGELELATKVALWMSEHMQDASGYFYYQKHRRYMNKISYMRWSNAWMLAALSALLLRMKK